MIKSDIICWADGNRCHGCAHYEGKAPVCAYRPPRITGRFAFWLRGLCSFKNIFVSIAEDGRIPSPPEAGK